MPPLLPTTHSFPRRKRVAGIPRQNFPPRVLKVQRRKRKRTRLPLPVRVQPSPIFLRQVVPPPGLQKCAQATPPPPRRSPVLHRRFLLLLFIVLYCRNILLVMSDTLPNDAINLSCDPATRSLSEPPLSSVYSTFAKWACRPLARTAPSNRQPQKLPTMVSVEPPKWQKKLELIALFPGSSTYPPALLMQNYASDPKFKKYTQQVERCLSSFDNVQEWADFISFLKQLLKVC